MAPKANLPLPLPTHGCDQSRHQTQSLPVSKWQSQELSRLHLTPHAPPRPASLNPLCPLPCLPSLVHQTSAGAPVCQARAAAFTSPISWSPPHYPHCPWGACVSLQATPRRKGHSQREYQVTGPRSRTLSSLESELGWHPAGSLGRGPANQWEMPSWRKAPRTKGSHQ